MLLYEKFPFLHTHALHIITFGDLSLVQKEIADRWVHPGEKILQVGYDSKQAFLNARRGADTICIDHRLPLLHCISSKAKLYNLSLYILPLKGEILNSVNIFKKNHFDIIQSTLIFGKLKKEERKRLLSGFWNLLKSDGTLIIIEKKEPSSEKKRFFLKCLEIPLHFIIRVLTGVTVIPVKNLETTLQEADFVLYEQRYFFFGTLVVTFAQKRLPA